MWLFLIIGTYVIILLAVAALSYRLGQTKTENPRSACLIGFLLALLPPLGLIYLAVLALKEDVGTV